jgi:hypothetical protein
MRKLAITALILVGTLFAAGNVYLSQISVPTEAIHSSVTRSEALLNRGWELPVAHTFKPALLWQSNPSTCGAASLANVFRSLSEREQSASYLRVQIAAGSESVLWV